MSEQEESDKTIQDWIDARPKCVQELAAEFPLPTAFFLDGKVYYLIGYTENDSLVVSPINPSEDYEGAVAMKSFLCAEHVRKAFIKLDQ